MRSNANKKFRGGTWQSRAAWGGLALAVLVVAWVATPLPANATASPSAQRDSSSAAADESRAGEVQALELHEGASGTRLEVATSGAPVWTTYRNAEGHLVVELPNALPADSVTSLAPEHGLLAAVEVEADESMDRPLTRLVIKTRGEAEHSVVAEGSFLRIELMPVGTREGATAWEFETDLAESEPAAPVEESRPAVSDVEPAPTSVEESVVPPAPPVGAVPMAPVMGPSGEPSGEIVASRLQGIEIGSDQGRTVVRIVGDGEFYYSTLTLRAPDRFVVDLVNVVNMASETNISVENELVERVRVAQFKPYPEPVSRVVVDLRQPLEAGVVSLPDGLALSFGASASVAEAYELTPTTEVAQVAALPTAEIEPVETAETLMEEPLSAEPVTEEMAVGMGADEAGGVGSHELSSLASAVAAGTLEEELETPEPEPVLYQPETLELAAPVQIAEMREAPEASAFTAQEAPAPKAPVAPPPATFERQAMGEVETRYQGAPMTISLKDGDIKDVLRSFAQISGLNVVVQPGVTGTVTVELTNVPWDQALEQILKINGLGYELEGNIMRVAPISQLRAEAQEQQQLREAQALSIPLQTMMKRISYASASEVAGVLKAGGGASLMSQRGSVVVDRRTNTLIIKELPSFMDTVLAVIETLDVPEPQVMIEARIIETTKRFASSLGIAWGFSGVADAAHGNTTDLAFPNQGTVDGGVSLLTGGSNGFLDITLGNVLNTFTLDMQLQAAENEGLINILSAPKITTLNNEQASIQSGLQIPIQTVANNTVSVQFVNATLRLDVTPHVTAEGTVLMDINIQKREPQLAFAVVGATNAPIATKDARTRVIVRDGGTTVIGGIYKVSTDRGEDRVPGLANVPIIGHLFKNKRQNNENEELLIFITPKVIKL